MARLTDGTRTIEIEMKTWEGSGYTPDWSNDFFEVGNLEYDEEKEAYKVRNVDYCIEQAQDWKNAQGDYHEDEPQDLEDREVFVDEITIEKKKLSEIFSQQYVLVAAENAFQNVDTTQSEDLYEAEENGFVVFAELSESEDEYKRIIADEIVRLRGNEEKDTKIFVYEGTVTSASGTESCTIYAPESWQ